MEDPLRAAYHRVRGLAHRGDRVTCPCCGGNFRGFLPFGRVRRENAQCPKCGSLERHRLLWLYPERSAGLLTSRLRMLHVAPELLLAKRLTPLPRLGYVSIDLESPQAMVRMDATRLGFRDGAFDVVLCLHVLEHIPDDRAAMGELLRVLAPGGRAILQVPLDEARAETFEDRSVVTPADRERVFGQRDHVRIYGRDYVDRLRAAGFSVTQWPSPRALEPAEVRRHGILQEDTLTLCTRD